MELMALLAAAGAGGLTTTTAREPSKASGELAKEDFLRLLSTQLRHQDPIQPVKDQEFLAQLAQFNALEQLGSLRATVERWVSFQESVGALGYAAGLLGRTVRLAGKDGGTEVVGTVTAVRVQNGRPALVVNGTTFALEQVLEVLP